jgi:sugar-phosphatase
LNPSPCPDKTFAAFLFDMDGTLLTSILAAERVWSDWARRHGVDVDTFLPTIHGVRAIDTIRSVGLPDIDAEAEAADVMRREIEDVAGVAAIGGAVAFLASLPAGRWAIVTSASRTLAERRLEAAGIPLPPMMITSEDIERGKPAPDCFLLAARRLGVRIDDCLVFEDAPAGIAAAEAAGAAIVVISATHAHPMTTTHPVIASYDALESTIDAQGRLRLVARS